jgi:hypothetical protein
MTTPRLLVQAVQGNKYPGVIYVDRAVLKICRCYSTTIRQVRAVLKRESAERLEPLVETTLSTVPP